MRKLRKTVCVSVLLAASVTAATAQNRHVPGTSRVPANTLLRIIRAEDERRWDENLKILLSNKNVMVRRRAALGAGRIGDERAVPALIDLLKDIDINVRQMAAFALGEIESPQAADALYGILADTSQPPESTARVVEALGKIAAALPEAAKERKEELGKAILGVLRSEADSRTSAHRLTILLGLTATLRAKPDGAGPFVVKFLDSSDPRIVADALNTMARLRLKDSNERVRQLLGHSDPIVRANAARVIGAKEDKDAFDALLDRALHDSDLRVRVSAIRALGALKDERAAQPLFERTAQLILTLRKDRPALRAMEGRIPPTQQNEWLEVYTTLGNILPGKPTQLRLPSGSPPAAFVTWHKKHIVREFEIAIAKSEPAEYVEDAEAYFHKTRHSANGFFTDWHRASSIAQALGVIATTTANEKNEQLRIRARKLLLEMINDRRLSRLALSDALTAYAAFKPDDIASVLGRNLKESDVIVRATAAELLGNLEPNETNTRALGVILKAELPRTEKGEMNDAALSILDALAKQKSAAANDAIKTALDSPDQLIRRRAVNLLKANGAGDFSDRIGFVKTRYTDADYHRAIARIGRTVRATVLTSKGAFTIEFRPEDAPLTVDNFVMLARKGYFNGQTVPRVVPNFVIQTGDPRGDQNGGPGYAIRCEINEVPYERAAVGMALSGKDTGGSQWFVTHSPQPHLDGGYTVFGRVISGMDVVDKIARGETIRRVTIVER